MNLNLGMVAANSFFREQDAQQARDQQQKRWDAENKRTDADILTLPEQIDANRSGYQIRSAQNRSGLETLPFRSRVEQGALAAQERNQQFQERMRPGLEALQSTDLQARIDRQPTDLQTAGLTSQMGLSNARIGQSDAQVAENGIPQRVTAGKQKQATDDYAQHSQTVATLAQAIDSGDSASVLKLINGLNEALPEAQRVKPAAKIGTIENGAKIIALDADGNPTGAPLDVAQMRKLANQGQSVKLKPGETIGTYSKSGFTPAYTAPDPSGSIAKQSLLQREITSLQEGFGMTKEQALDYYSSGKKPSKTEYVLKGLNEKRRQGYDITPQDEADLSAQYDRVAAASRPNLAAPSAQPSAVGKSGVNYRDFLK